MILKIGHSKRLALCNLDPCTQPGLWCQWDVLDDMRTLKWNEVEKFYDYTEWLEYIIRSILAPRGYTLNGSVIWTDDYGSAGVISVLNNQIATETRELDD
jgi:hypothetical protein